MSTTTTSRIPSTATVRPPSGTTRPLLSPRQHLLRRPEHPDPPAAGSAAPVRARAGRPARRSRRRPPSRRSPGTTATRPAAAAGSATAWSMAILVSPGQISSSRVGLCGDRPQARGQVGVLHGEQVEQHGGPGDEHARVPPVLAPRRGTARPCSASGFSTNAATACAVAKPGQRLAELDVAERRSRAAPARCRSSPAARCAATAAASGDARTEGVRVGDHVVGGERAEQRIGIAALDDRRGQADRRHRVPRAGLGDHLVRGQALELGRTASRWAPR